MENGQHNLVENIILKNSPYWTFWAHGVSYLEVRNVDISARRTDHDGHDIIDGIKMIVYVQKMDQRICYLKE